MYLSKLMSVFFNFSNTYGHLIRKKTSIENAYEIENSSEEDGATKIKFPTVKQLQLH